MRNRGFTWLIAVLCLLPGAGSAIASPDGPSSYDLRTLELPVPGLIQSIALGINNRGQILGSYYDGTAEQGFVYDNHGLTTLPIADQNVIGIDDRGRIVGCSYVYDDGEFTPINFPGAVSSCVLGINDRGQLVGNYNAGVGSVHGFFYERGVFTAIDAPNASLTYLRAINNRGQILGYYVTDDFHWFVYDHGEFRSIDLRARSGAFLQSINDRGQMVGSYPTVDGERGFLYDDGAMIDIAFPGASVTEAFGINNRGEIVGFYYPPGAEGLASFVATPTYAGRGDGRP